MCGSALALPFEDAAFDAVSAFDVIEHCEPEATALAEVRRVLRPGGKFVMSVPAYTWAWTDFDVANGHHRRYTKGRAVAAVERAGFTVQRATYGFATVFPMFAAERLSRKVVASPRRRAGRHRLAPPAARADQPHAARPVAGRPGGAGQA